MLTFFYKMLFIIFLTIKLVLTNLECNPWTALSLYVLFHENVIVVPHCGDNTFTFVLHFNILYYFYTFNTDEDNEEPLIYHLMLYMKNKNINFLWESKPWQKSILEICFTRKLFCHCKFLHTKHFIGINIKY